MSNVYHYDYLIVGSGLFGSVFAYEMKKREKKCLVIDKRVHLGGNIHCERIEGINTHLYGAHIFHTSDEYIWKYVNKFVSFNHYINSPLANYNGKLYNLPFNMNTFYQLWGTRTPDEAKQKISEQIDQPNLIDIPTDSLQGYALKTVGHEIYEKFIRHYTEKQWGRKASELPASIVKRIPLRFTFNNNYFNDTHQGIPKGGYNLLINGLLMGIETKTATCYFENKDYFNRLAKKIVFTGKIDEFFDYKFGKLEYRSLRFETELLPIDNYQGNAVVNYTDAESPYTRIYEHKHFEFGNQPQTVITREYPIPPSIDAAPFYPIDDHKNRAIYRNYAQLAASEINIIFGGRLAEYRYYDMHQVIASAIKKAKKEAATFD